MIIVRKLAVMIALACAGTGAGLSAYAAAASASVESCSELRKHGHATEAAACYGSLSQSADVYLRAEGFWGLKDYAQANEAFRAAVVSPNSKADDNALRRVRWGMLLHERFNNPDADDLFNEALKIEPAGPAAAQAYLGLATVSEDGFDSHAEDYAKKAIEIDPKLVEAHELIANLDLENSDPAGAAAEADKAIELSSEALQGYAIHAAIEVLADRSPNAWFDRIRTVNPNYGEGYALVGYHLVLNRRYEDGVAYYRKAVDADPLLWPARSQLGINLMRLGQQDEPTRLLQSSYDNGQRDAATVNSLRLLDSYKNFVTVKDDTTILRFDKSEADLLQPYFQPELHKILVTYQAKYKLKLPAPVQVEVYPNHEDFAVRTMGMPGLGALGVTFGEVVAMDSPSGRPPGEFNWGATLWHEMSHVYILQATNHRVPRWFTEGLAVHEEGQANPEWANRLTPDILIAIRDKKLLPVAQIDRGFIYPEYPEQVLVSYYQAGTICDYIQERWGADKLLDLVHSFAQLKTTPEAIREDLGMSPEDFDKAYLVWLDKKAGPTAANFDTWRKQLKDLAALAKDNKNDEVLKAAPDVIHLYTEYVDDANAYELLSAAELAKDDKQGAMATLMAYRKAGGEHPDALDKLASLQEELGDKKGAAETLNAINFIYPESEALHRHLGDLWFAQGNYAGAEREYAAVLALNPLDKASAEFNLAQAYYGAGQKDKAEDSVLLALESAPGFRPAQKLLVQITSADNPTGP